MTEYIPYQMYSVFKVLPNWYGNFRLWTDGQPRIALQFLLMLVLISSAAASKRKAKRTHSSVTRELPEAAAVKGGGSAYETNEYAKYEGDSKGERVQVM